ncbi:MAG: hypothetical protein ACFFBP_06560 [Promethearchaeota archaeon]
MSNIYLPINASDVKDVIPIGEDIIYSTLALGYEYLGNREARWSTQLLITPNGIAFKVRSDSGLVNRYYYWHEIQTIINYGKFGPAIFVYKRKLSNLSVALARNENIETKEEFKERLGEFLDIFRPILIEKKQQWLEKAYNDPEVSQKAFNQCQKDFIDLIKKEKKRSKKQKKS